jgi:hypothetical protein
MVPSLEPAHVPGRDTAEDTVYGSREASEGEPALERADICTGNALVENPGAERSRGECGYWVPERRQGDKGTREADKKHSETHRLEACGQANHLLFRTPTELAVGLALKELALRRIGGDSPR